MNLLIIVGLFLTLLIWEYRTRREKMTRGEKRLYWVLAVLAILSAAPASIGLGFDNVGASLSGMISILH